VEIYAEARLSSKRKKERDCSGRVGETSGLKCFAEAHEPAHCVLFRLCERWGADGHALPAAEGGIFAGEENAGRWPSHAALSMEKCGGFATGAVEKAVVEDIDAISDYIAVHDQA